MTDGIQRRELQGIVCVLCLYVCMSEVHDRRYLIDPIEGAAGECVCVHAPVCV